MIRYDPSSPEIIANPYPVLRELQGEERISHVDSVGGWMVTRHAHVTQGLKEPALSSNRVTPFFERLEPGLRERFRALQDSIEGWSIFQDPPRHTRLRAAFSRAFTGRQVRELQQRVAQLVDMVLERLRGREEFDFIGEFAYPLPALVICHMLGLPEQDIGRIREWSDGIARFIGLPHKPLEQFEAAARSNGELTRYFGEVIARRRAEPGSCSRPFPSTLPLSFLCATSTSSPSALPLDS